MDEKINDRVEFPPELKSKIALAQAQFNIIQAQLTSEILSTQIALGLGKEYEVKDGDNAFTLKKSK